MLIMLAKTRPRPGNQFGSLLEPLPFKKQTKDHVHRICQNSENKAAARIEKTTAG